VWSFQVRAGREDDFEQLHGADGDWTALSRRKPIVSRQLIPARAGRPAPVSPELTYWSEMLIYEKHLSDYGDEVTELQTRGWRWCPRRRRSASLKG